MNKILMHSFLVVALMANASLYSQTKKVPVRKIAYSLCALGSAISAVYWTKNAIGALRYGRSLGAGDISFGLLRYGLTALWIEAALEDDCADQFEA